MCKKVYRLAPKFSEDHWDRECGENDVIVKQNQRFVYVEMDQAGYDDMLSDADYYYTCRDQFDEYFKDICYSAKNVKDALIKQGAPNSQC
jgi:hypothetical protein